MRKGRKQYNIAQKVFVVKQKRSYDVRLILEFYFQPGSSEREIDWFELILQLQTAQCQMFIDTVNVTLIYF